MERIWLQHYPDGVPASIDSGEYGSVVELLAQSVRRYGEADAYINFGHAISYRDLDRLATRFATYLQQTAGLRQGERFALMMPNLLQYPVAVFGCLRAGLTVVNVNPLYSARELEHQLRDSGASGILIAESSAHTLEKVLPRTALRHIITTSIGEMLPWPRRTAVNLAVRYLKKLVPPFRLPGAVAFSRALREGARRQLQPVPVGAEDVAFLQYTGGTTGLAKGAVLTHGNIVANVQQAAAWIGPWITPGEETVVTALPLYHVFALTANCLVFLKIGGRNILITNPRDIRGLVRELGRWPFSILTGVNTLFNALLNARGFAELDFSHLKLTLGGGMAIQQAVAARWQKVTGKAIVEAYGLTETSPAACVNPLDIAGYTGSIGMPLPSTECKIVDEAGNEVAPGESGELCIRGPQVMRGYWQRPQETRAAFTADGFLRTGDMARMDERGCFYIVDRKKDMILVSGFNVYPNEVEDVAAQCPGVLEAACVGVPDAKSGEAVKLVVVRADPALTADAIKAHCRRNLAAYKCPRHIEFRDTLPKSQVGKILRKDLKDHPRRRTSPD